MKPNVVIKNGRLEVVADVGAGQILLHADFPLGLAARDVKAGDVLEYDPIENTEDVTIRARPLEWEWATKPAPPDKAEWG